MSLELKTVALNLLPDHTNDLPSVLCVLCENKLVKRLRLYILRLMAGSVPAVICDVGNRDSVKCRAPGCVMMTDGQFSIPTAS